MKQTNASRAKAALASDKLRSLVADELKAAQIDLDWAQEQMDTATKRMEEARQAETRLNALRTKAGEEV